MEVEEGPAPGLQTVDLMKGFSIEIRCGRGNGQTTKGNEPNGNIEGRILWVPEEGAGVLVLMMVRIEGYAEHKCALT